MENETWVGITVRKFWQKKAKNLDFIDFLMLYVDLMMFRNGIFEKEFRTNINLKEKKEMDLLELYFYLQD